MWLVKSAEQGCASAQYALGFCYVTGRGVEQDYTKAAEWHSKAAKQGHPESQYYLGCYYWNGLGVEQDISLAQYWYSAAAKQGHKGAVEAIKRIEAKAKGN